MLREIPDSVQIPLLLFILGGSILVALLAAFSDLVTWISRARRSSPPAFTELFRGWPLVVWVLSAALLPDLQFRVAAGAMFFEHLVLRITLAQEQRGRVIAGEPPRVV